MTEEADLLPICAAARRVGTTPNTLRKRVKDGTLPIFTRPLDLADVNALTAPRQADPQEAPPMTA